jgi:hypothetical protein
MEPHVRSVHWKQPALGGSGFRVASLREDQPARRIIHRRQKLLEHVRAEDDQVAVTRERVEHVHRHVAEHGVPEHEALAMP